MKLLALAVFSVISFKAYATTVICYHQITQDDYAQKKKNDFILAQSKFKNQIRYIKENDFVTVYGEELNKGIANSVMLTFDDGVDGFYKYAMPLLLEYKMKATLFIAPGLLGNKPFLDLAKLKEIKEKGFRIEAMGFNHKALTSLRKSERSKSIRLTKEYLKQKLGISTTWFAFPFGTFDTDLQTLLKQFGFKGAFTMLNGAVNRVSPPYALNRFTVLKQHSLSYFKNQLKMKSLAIRKVIPSEGSKVYERQAIRVYLPKQLELTKLLITSGEKFIGQNKTIPFRYNKDSGELSFKLPGFSDTFAIVSINYLDNEDFFSNTLLYKIR